MPFLLMVFLVLVCLPELDSWQKPPWTDSPLACVAATSLAVLLSALHAFWVARRFCVRLEKEPSRREYLLGRYDRGRFHQQILLFGLYLLALLGLGWGWSVAQLWRRGDIPLPGAELLILAPFVIAQMLAWTAYYDAERATHQSTLRLLSADAHTGAWLELERTRAATLVPFGSRWAYVLFQLRQKLALAFLPVVMFLVTKELQRRFPEVWQEWPKVVNLLGIVAVLIVFAVMPWTVRLVLGLKPMPDSPLRRRLDATARRLRFRCSDILVWNTRNGMANALMIGILPWLRYVVFTDRLLEDFTPEEIEAVYGHEVGHIRHSHIPYYFSFLTVSVLVLFWLINELFLFYKGADPFELSSRASEYVSIILLVTVLLGYIFMVFGFLSRRCERQADVFGCRAVSCASPNCRGHEDDVPFAPSGQGLCPTGINTFIRALEKVAAVNGINRDRPGFLQSWQHGSIGRRIEFLQRVLLDLDIERRFQRRVFVFKTLLLLVLGGSVAFIFIHDWNSSPEMEQPRSQLATDEHR